MEGQPKRSSFLSRLHPALLLLLLFPLFYGRKALSELRIAAGSIGAAQLPARLHYAALVGEGAGSERQARQLRQPPPGQNDSYVAMCIAVKDEHCDIREWVLHHAALGAGKVYLFDTQSEVPMRGVVEDLIESGLVAYHYVTNSSVELRQPGEGRSHNWQAAIYPLCLERYGPRHRWMAFIDADEFIVLRPEVPTLRALLQRFEQYGGLAMHWLVFSSGGRERRPEGGVLRSYTTCCPQHGANTVKSIVQPARVEKMETVHTFHYKEGFHAVRATGATVETSKRRGRGLHHLVALHHYITKSLADFELKMRRRGGAGSIRTLDDYTKWVDRCNSTCAQAVPLGQELGARFDLARGVPASCAAGGQPLLGEGAGAADTARRR